MSGPLDAFGNAATEVAKAVTGAENRKALQEAAKDTPAMDLAGQRYARNLGIRQQAIFALYQPLRWFHLVPDKYFEEQFWDDLATKLQDVPEDQRQTPKHSIAGPAMEGLAYSIDEPDLKEMYLNLLAGASNVKKAPQVHPSFVEIIRQLSAEEVPALDSILRSAQEAVAEIRMTKTRVDPDELPSTLQSFRRLTICLESHGPADPLGLPQIPLWLVNWQRHGLIEITFDAMATGVGDTDAYAWVVESVPHKWADESLRYRTDLKNWDITFEKGIVRPTEFGLQFHKIVGQPN